MTDHNIQELRREADDRRDAIVRDVDLVADRIAPGRIADRQKAKLRQGIGGMRDTVFGSSDQSRLAGTGHDSLRDKASGAIDRANEATPDSVSEFAEGNPLAAGLIGIGIGLLAATLMPTSREEQRFADGAQDTLQDIASVVGRAGHETADAIRPAAEEAAADVKSTARDAIDTVKDDAKGAADEVKTSAQEDIGDVRNDQ